MLRKKENAFASFLKRQRRINLCGTTLVPAESRHSCALYRIAPGAAYSIGALLRGDICELLLAALHQPAVL